MLSLILMSSLMTFVMPAALQEDNNLKMICPNRVSFLCTIVFSTYVFRLRIAFSMISMICWLSIKVKPTSGPGWPVLNCALPILTSNTGTMCLPRNMRRPATWNLGVHWPGQILMLCLGQGTVWLDRNVVLWYIYKHIYVYYAYNHLNTSTKSQEKCSWDPQICGQLCFRVLIAWKPTIAGGSKKS